MKKFLIIVAAIVLCVFGWQFLRGFFSPVMRDLDIRKEVVKGLEAARPFQAAVLKKYSSESVACTSNAKCDIGDVNERTFSVAIGSHAAITVAFKGINPYVDGSTVILKPRKSKDGLRWDCRGGTLPAQYRPAACRAKRPPN